MTASLPIRLRNWALFAACLLGSVVAREGESRAVDQAIIWLPTGVAISGLWLLGLEAVWVVFATTLVQRLALGYHVDVGIPAAFGSSAEAILGVLLLRALDTRPGFARLRDVLGLFMAAAVAPAGSILFSAIGRATFWHNPQMPFYSGWDGWWRMNALGALAVIPVAGTWLGLPIERLGPRRILEALLVVVGTTVLLEAQLTSPPPEGLGIGFLSFTVFIAMYAAVRFGPRGAASTAVLAAMLVAGATYAGHGPFMSIGNMAIRHDAVQLFELSLIGIPLVFGALIAEREANIALRHQSEAVQGAFIRALPDVAYRIRADGTFLEVYVPEGVETPFQADELLGHRIQEILPEVAVEATQQIAEALTTGRIPASLEYEVMHHGRVRSRESRCVRLSDSEVLVQVRDITERKRAERQVKWEAEFLGMVATGRPPREVFPALVQGIEGLSDGGLGSLLLLQGRRLHVACAPSLPSAYNAAIEGVEIGPGVGSCGTAAHENRTVVVADISTDPLWADYRALALSHGLHACWSVPIRSPDGAVLGTFAIYYRTPRAPQASELEWVERAAAFAGIALDREAREDLLTSLNRNVNEGLYRSTPDRGLVYVNLAFARMFGYDSPEEMLHLTSARLYEDPARREALQRVITAHGFFVNEEVRFRRRDGSVFWGLVTSTGVQGPDGQVRYYDGAVADITARKELEDQLRQAQKMEALGKLAGGVAHDFNNLLTAIAGYGEAVREAVPEEGQLRSDIDEVLNAASRAASLTRQLLAYSRQQLLTPQVVDLGATVAQLSALLRRLIGEDIALVTLAAGGSTSVRVDRGQIEQVILNLAVNARDAMPQGGTLTIATECAVVGELFARTHLDLEPGAYVVLSVRDTGVGMAPEVRSRAFDPFFTTKALGKGTGLGLSTVYGIVRQSGGAVRLDSTPGAGTTVWLYLPHVAATAERESPPPVAEDGPVDATVLLVEDERVVRDLARRTLARAGYRVLEASDGEEALEVSRRHPGPIDLVVSDVVMPRMGGRALVARLLAERPGLRVLFMSGYPNDAGDLREVTGAAGNFLQKPFAPSQLLARASGLLSPGRVGS